MCRSSSAGGYPCPRRTRQRPGDSPHTQAADAAALDTSSLTIDAAVARAIQFVDAQWRPRRANPILPSMGSGSAPALTEGGFHTGRRLRKAPSTTARAPPLTGREDTPLTLRQTLFFRYGAPARGPCSAERLTLGIAPASFPHLSRTAAFRVSATSSGLVASAWGRAAIVEGWAKR